VRCLSWGPNDATLVSAGSDGALFCWDWEAQKRIGESVTKGVSYASCFMAQVI
jgi:WD40 repeat protein